MENCFNYEKFQASARERLAQIFAESLGYESDMISEEQEILEQKMDALLDCQEMEKCHPFLYSLNRENISECDKQKIHDLYECAVKRNFIITEDDEDEVNIEPEQTEIDSDDVIDRSSGIGVVDQQKLIDKYGDTEDSLCGGPTDSLLGQELQQKEAPAPEETLPNFTVMYSASHGGHSTTGMFYSHAIDNKSAQEDCIKRLSEAGYSAIQIWAIDQNRVGVGDYNPDDGNQMYAESQDEELHDTASQVERDMIEGNDESSVSDENKEVSSEENTEKTEDTENEKDETSEGPKKLTAEQKNALKNEYTDVFKTTLKEIGNGKSFGEMTVDKQIEFLTKMQSAWVKDDPSLFMDDKDREKLNKITVDATDEQ